MTTTSSTVLGFVLLLLIASKAQGRTAPAGRTGVSTPPVGDGRELPLTRTGGADFAEWARHRLALAVVDLAALEPPVDASRIDDVALALVAQWAHETAKGRAEFNYNLGGWTARSGDDYHAAMDRLSGRAFRWTAYPDLPTAVEDQIKRLAVGFPGAWALLLADPTSDAWIAELGRAGYYTASPADYAHAWASLAQEIRRLPR